MAENIGSGIKISQLPDPVGMSNSDYMVIVHDGSTCKTSLGAVQNFFNNEASDLTSSVERIKGEVYSLSSKTTENEEKIDSLCSFVTTSVSGDILFLNGKINTNARNIAFLSNDMKEISAATLSTVSLLSVIVENPNLLNVLSALSEEDLSDTIPGLIDSVSELTEDTAQLKLSSDLFEETDEYHERYLNAILEKSKCRFPLLINLGNGDSFNPIIVDTSDPNYKYRDIYCFGNSYLYGSDGLPYLSANNDSILLSVVYVDGIPTYRNPPGKSTFDLRGAIPIRTSMFSSDNSNNFRLDLHTRGDTNVDIYLTKSMFFTTASTLSIEIAEVGELILKNKLDSSSSGTDEDLVLVWSGDLESSSSISFMASGTSIKANNLIGAIVPRLKMSEKGSIDVGLKSIEIGSGSGPGSLTFSVYAEQGYNKQVIPLSIAISSISQEETTIYSDQQFNILMAEFPRIGSNNLTKYTIQSIILSDIGALSVIGYNDTTNSLVYAEYENFQIPGFVTQPSE